MTTFSQPGQSQILCRDTSVPNGNARYCTTRGDLTEQTNRNPQRGKVLDDNALPDDHCQYEVKSNNTYACYLPFLAEQPVSASGSAADDAAFEIPQLGSRLH
ncbi:hypothetical protein INT43_007523 [Umbelopsis isabellina]|uniref:Uncharacterized protein n=1 Tax=Mortierella isabellina TaxID=91625 RepID=A0A8H7PY93_MORIS|nr:hypothetical protein INT43_007523 [Umbelopsis isabellina]